MTTCVYVYIYIIYIYRYIIDTIYLYMNIDQEVFSEEPRPNRRPFKAFFAFELPLRVSEPSDVSWGERRETT
jgi:hypothetical protein